MSGALHKCSVCHTEGVWTDSWVWYGSYRELDDGAPVVKLCSAKCKAEHSRRRKVASTERVRARQRAALAMRGML